jgi:hypothetical protein
MIGASWPPSTKDMQLVTEGEVLQLQNDLTAESAGKNRHDRTRKLEHVSDTTVANPRTLDFL